MSCFLALSGFHKSGKTVLGSYIVKNLTQRNYKVAVVKSSQKTQIFTDIPQKDTWIYRENGAHAVALFQKNFFTLFIEPEKLNLLSYKDWYNYFLSLFWNFDLVLFEGFKQFDILPKIWIIKDENENLKEVKKNLKNLLGFVVKNKEYWQKRYPEEFFWDINEKDEILNFILEFINKDRRRVLLRVNGRKIPLKDFVEDIISSTTTGLIRTLKGIPEDIRDIEIKINCSNILDKKVK